MVLLRNLLGVLLCLLVACPSDIALSIDVNGELKNALLEKQSSSPTGYEGRIYYNTTSKLPEFYNGTAWTSLGSMAGLNTPGLVSNEHTISASDVSSSSEATGTLSWRIDVVGRVVNFYGFFNITGTNSHVSTFSAALPDGFRPPNAMIVFCRFYTLTQAMYFLQIDPSGDLFMYKRTFTAASGMSSANFANTSQENAIACGTSWPKTGT